MSEDKKVTRREATGKIIGLLALATGMTVTQVSDALGQWKPKRPDSTKYQPRTPLTKTPTQKPTLKPIDPNTSPARMLIVSQKSNDAALTKLKVALEDDMTVFENQYGRLTPVKQVRAEQFFGPGQVPPDLAGDIIGVCVTNFGSVAGNIGAVNLGYCEGINNCHGQGLDGSCDGINTCTGGQDCSDMARCEENTCTGGQDCSKHQSCTKNSQSIVTEGMLSNVANDLYVQLLMQEFNVKTTAALADAINTHFNNIAQGNESIWPPH